MTKNENTWSDLPVLIVWMIKDRLDFPTNLRFASVCKNWHHISLSYTVNHHQSTIESPPWIMMTEDISQSKRDFINISTGEKYTIDLPDFRNTIVLYSKKAWLLLVKTKHIKKRYLLTQIVDPDTNSPFLLLNPFTKAMIKLPLIQYISEPYGAFTIADSNNPQLVVLASAALFNRGSFDWVHLWTIRVGVDEEWSGYCSTKWQLPTRVEMILRVVIVGHLAYFFNKNSHVFVFDLLNLQFQETVKTTTDEFSSKSCWFSVMENRGEIYKVVLADWNCGVIPMFYRLKKITKNNTEFDWEGLNSEEFKDKCWYLIRSQGYQCFVFEEKGQCEIYQNLGVWYDEYFKIHFFEGNLVKKVMSQPIQGCVIKDWADMG